MFRNSLSKSLSGFVKNRFVAYCEEGGDLIEQVRDFTSSSHDDKTYLLIRSDIFVLL